jgi:hypothetical protein
MACSPVGFCCQNNIGRVLAKRLSAQTMPLGQARQSRIA